MPRAYATMRQKGTSAFNLIGLGCWGEGVVSFILLFPVLYPFIDPSLRKRKLPVLRSRKGAVSAIRERNDGSATPTEGKKAWKRREFYSKSRRKETAISRTASENPG